ncbi:ArsR/SmtB family transcription factor [Bacillus daqingensis]|uniref:ArsR/SmtB family transcription factor n=1 Tax=Bacillus daqingensis TaxID=872396 RepID=A0ABV9NX86_9BACI
MELPLSFSTTVDYAAYEKQFKALGDQKRLQILHLLCERGELCVCDLTELVHLPQSKLSYHVKLLLDAGLITREKRGTWNYYSANPETMNHLFSEELCCIFRPAP